MLETYKNMRKVVDNSENLYKISDTDLIEIQKTLADMLFDIDEFCNKNQLSYALCGGTCLGSVRHKGFIPWDDDMDICMPRRDYEKFLKLFQKEYESQYWVQNIKMDKKYDLHFSKIRKKGTKFEEIYESEPKKAGIFIDIFPLDDTFDNCFLRLAHQICCDGLLLICSCVRMRGKLKRLLQYVGDDKKVKTSMYLKSAIGLCFSFLPLRKWMLITEKVISFYRNPKARYGMIPSGIGHAMGETYCKKWFFPAKKIKFEGQTRYTLRNPRPYLTKLYGDYMTIPNAENRLKHNVVNYQNRLE